MTERAKGFNFPCEYAVKAMGIAEPGFDALIVEIVQRHCKSVREGAVSTRESRNGKYLSVTVAVEAQSFDQLNAIYKDLTAHDKVLMRL